MKSKRKIIISYISIFLILFSLIPTQVFAVPSYSESLKTVDVNGVVTNGNPYESKEDVWILFGSHLPYGDWDVVVTEPSGDPELGSGVVTVDEEHHHFNLWDLTGGYDDSSIGHGEYKVTATLTYEDGNGRSITVSKSDNFFVKSAEIKLTKTASVSKAYPGDTVYYTFKVENKGDFNLENIVITDPLFGEEWSLTKDSLDTHHHDSWTSEPVEYTIPEDGTLPLTNTATVVADVSGHSGMTVTDTDSATIDPYNASIQIVKTVDPLYALPGETVYYTFVVTNTGDEKLYDVTITDPLFGEEWSYTFDGYLKAGKSFDPVVVPYEIPENTEFPLENTATVTGNFHAPVEHHKHGEPSYISHPVTDDDDAVVMLKVPEVTIEKTVDMPVAFPGDTVEYTFTVTNTGTMDLFNLTVTDPMFEEFDHTIESLPVGSDPVSFTETYTIPLEASFPIENTATVEAYYDEEEDPISDSATAMVEEAMPGIEIVKTAGQELAMSGDEIEYTLVVTNTGNVTLYGVHVTDEMLGYDETIGNLEPGESSDPIVLYYTVPAEASFPIENTANAMGYYRDEEEAFVEDDDSASVEEAIPAIQIDKSVSPEYANIGDEVTYTFTVTNIGNVDLFGVNVTDPLFGDWEHYIGELPAGSEPVTFTEKYTIPAETSFPLINTAAVVGYYGEEKAVRDTDSATVNEKVELLFGLDIQKSANRSVIESPETVTYTIVVTNTGTTTLYNILVEDPLLGFSDTIDVLEPEASQTFTLSKNLTLSDRNSGTAFVNTATATVVVYDNQEQPTTLSDTDNATVVINRAPRDNPTPTPTPTPPTEDVPVDTTPLSAPDVPEVAPTEIVPEVLPLDVPVLPQTGELPPALFYSIGGLLSGIGVLIRRKNAKK